MPHRPPFWIAILAVGVLFFSGCATSRSVVKTEKDFVNPPPPVEDAILSTDPAALAGVEKRAEGFARFANGYSLELRNEDDQALEQYFQAAIADPGNEPLVLDISRLLIQKKQGEKALSLLIKASSATNSTGAVWVALGWAYTQAGKTNEAILAHRQAIKKDPDTPLAYQSLVPLLLQSGQRKEAVKALNDAGRVTSSDPAFLIDLAELQTRFNQQAQTGEAIPKPQIIGLLNRARALSPEQPAVLLKLADGYNLMGEIKPATEIYLSMLEHFSDNPRLRDNIREKLTDLFIRGKDRKHAAEQLEAILRDNPTNPQAYYYLGSLSFDEKDYDKAAEYFGKTILLNPEFEQGYYDVAGAQINANKPDDALKTLEKARAKFPQNRFALDFYTGLAHLRKKDFTEAVKAFTAAEVLARATDTNRLTPLFYFQIGAALERNHAFAESEVYFLKCLDMDPDFAEALNYLGYMWAERGVNLDKAKTYIEKALKQEPENPAYLDSIAWVYYKLNKPKEALPHMLKAAKLTEPEDATVYEHLGDIYAALKQWDKAREAWRKSVDIEPNPQIQKKIDDARMVPGS